MLTRFNPNICGNDPMRTIQTYTILPEGAYTYSRIQQDVVMVESVQRRANALESPLRVYTR